MRWLLHVPEQDWGDPDVPPSPYRGDPATASIGSIDGNHDPGSGDVTVSGASA